MKGQTSAKVSKEQPIAIVETDDVFEALDELAETEVVAMEAVEVDELEEIETSDVDEETLVDIVAAAEIQEAKAEAYKEQDEKLAAREERALTPQDPEDESVTAKPKKKSASRISTAGMKPSQILKTKLGDKVYEFLALENDDLALDDAARKAKIDAFMENELDSLAKKVAEKAVNLIQHLAQGVSLSTYTKIAIELLQAGETSGDDIKKRYLARPYTPGTSNAQSSQMMVLLPALKLAIREGRKLKPNPDSTLLPMLAAS